MLRSFLSQPLAKSLLIGLLIAGPAYWLLLAGMPGFYHEHLAGLPGLPPICTRSVTVTITQMAWAWIGAGIAGSYWGYTRHLVRSSPAGYWAYCLMWLLYIGLFWLGGLLYFSWPDEIVPGREPFFG